MKKILSFLLVTILFGCNSTSNPISPSLNEEFELKYGEIAKLKNQDLIIKFISVVEDSRCPEGAVCIWAGNGKIKLQINKAEISLNTTLNPKEADISNYKIKLITLQPYPKLNEEIVLEDYICRLIISEQ